MAIADRFSVVSNGPRSISGRVRRQAYVQLGLLLVTVAVGTGGLWWSTTAARELQQITDATRAHQQLDMVHDALHADVLTAEIARQKNDAVNLDRAREDVLEQRSVAATNIAYLSATRLAPPLATRERAAIARFVHYLDAASLLVDAAEPPLATRAAFDTLFTDLEHDLGALTEELAHASATARARADTTRWRALATIAVVAVIAIAIAMSSGRRLRRTLARSITDLGVTAGRVVAGDLSARAADDPETEFGILGGIFNEVSASMEQLVGQLRDDASRVTFGRELVAALEMVDDEAELTGVAHRALSAALGDASAQLLLEIAQDGDLTAVAGHGPGPGCSVKAGAMCPAIRRGTTITFRSSEDLDACRHLVGRGDEPLTAACAPVSFMGRALGVVHAARPADLPFESDHGERVTMLASHVGHRVGTLRAFARSAHEATTDALTGLLNRRSLEGRVSALYQRAQPFVVVVADLDHFKALNDTYGHETGDRALRLFADVLRSATRADDLVARWGGEEFTLVFPSVTIDTATTVADRIREALARACATAKVPAFTVSMGLADSSMGENLSELLALADAALYEAKDGGRNTIRVVNRPGPIAHHPVPSGLSEGDDASDHLGHAAISPAPG